MQTPPDLRFGGIARLFGEPGLARLAAAHVAVIGVGGVGSWTVEALARSGVGRLTLIDLDEVCVTNINRQLPALQSTVGRSKVSVLAERVADIHPGCIVHARETFFTEATAAALLAPEPPLTWVVDAIDSLNQKALLVDACHRRGIPVLTIGGAGGRRDGSGVRVSDLGETEGDNLLRQLRRRLRREHGWDRVAQGDKTRYGVTAVFSREAPVFPWADGVCRTEPEPGSELKLDCASGFGTGVFVTGVFGFVAAGEVVRRIAVPEGN